jgi:hypothetical protein
MADKVERDANESTDNGSGVQTMVRDEETEEEVQLSGTEGVLNELGKFQEALDDADEELTLEDLRAWAGHINFVLAVLIKEINENFSRLGLIEDEKEEVDFDEEDYKYFL